MLAGPADYTRPANPWPRLILFFTVVLGALSLMGLCTVTFLDTPDRELRVRTNEFQADTPKFLAVVSFGHDRDQMTFGAFLAVPENEVGALALFSREPDSGCNLRWEPNAPGGGADAPQGSYIDPCSDARYAFDGRALHEGATRDLHRFDVRRDTLGYMVNFEQMTLGACRGDNRTACSHAGQEIVQDVPRGLLPRDFGTR